MDGEEYKKYADDLGKKYEILDLYFKPYAGCRWGHPAIDAVVFLMRRENVTYKDIEKVVIKTFYQATRLSKIVPKTTDESQYNIAYPTACGIVWGDFGFEQARDENLGDERVIEMMSRLSFEKDDEIDAMFPEHRCCKAVITLKDGRVIEGDLCEPRGEAHEGFGFEWIEEKFRRMSKAVMTDEALDRIMNIVKGDLNVKVREIVDVVNDPKNWTDR
jgi:2-methylcitrate dehydratase PrpD